MPKFELSASVVLWRGGEMLVMKRGAAGFAGGGWFIPGGHVEDGERPVEACARELFEETGIVVEASALRLVEIMSYEAGGAMAHTVIYSADCPDGAECAINDEPVAVRWVTGEAYIARFLDGEMLRSRGVGESAVARAEEVARVVRGAAAARG